MNLGITGRSAILMASTRGLGRACAESLAHEGVHVVINGRTQADVERTCDELHGTHGVNATPIVGDATTTEVHDKLLAACPEPDIVLLNGEGPPPSSFGDIDAGACPTAYAFGKDGKPLYIAGPHDTPARIRKILRTLIDNVGEDNFDYVLPFDDL